MKRKLVAALAAFSTFGTGLVGSAAFGQDKLVTIFGMAGILVAVLMDHNKTTTIWDSLRNGTLEQLVKDALIKAQAEQAHQAEAPERRREDSRNG